MYIYTRARVTYVTILNKCQSFVEQSDYGTIVTIRQLGTSIDHSDKFSQIRLEGIYIKLAQLGDRARNHTTR